MDEAARRVNPAALTRLADLRKRREDEAARRLRGLADDRAAAEAARARAAEAVATRRDERRAGERAIYAALTVAGPVALGRLEDRRLAVARFGEAVAEAQAHEADRAKAEATARAAHEAGRAEHARRAHETRKWDRACTRIAEARRAFAEVAEEAEAEEETALRFAARAGA